QVVPHQRASQWVSVSRALPPVPREQLRPGHARRDSGDAGRRDGGAADAVLQGAVVGAGSWLTSTIACNPFLRVLSRRAANGSPRVTDGSRCSWRRLPSASSLTYSLTWSPSRHCGRTNSRGGST